jgi:hypothetical protein
MEAILVIFAVILCLMGALLIGLLRSHAATLRSLAELEERLPRPPNLPHRDSDAPTAYDISGQTPLGDALSYPVASMGSSWLLAFLSSGCGTCEAFWASLATRATAGLPGNIDILVVTKDRATESPSRVLDLSPADIPVVMSSAAWEQYAVAGSPYFVFVDSSGRIAGEGTARTWAQVKSLFRDFLFDIDLSSRFDFSRLASVDRSPIAILPRDDIARDDAALDAAGLRRGDPSLVAPFFDDHRDESSQDSSQDLEEGRADASTRH